MRVAIQTLSSPSAQTRGSYNKRIRASADSEHRVEAVFPMRSFFVHSNEHPHCIHRCRRGRITSLLLPGRAAAILGISALQPCTPTSITTRPHPWTARSSTPCSRSLPKSSVTPARFTPPDNADAPQWTQPAIPSPRSSAPSLPKLYSPAAVPKLTISLYLAPLQLQVTRAST